MKSLLARVFFSLWAAMGLIIMASIGLTAVIAWHRISTLDDIDTEALTRNAETALQTDGPAGLKEWLLATRNAFPGIDMYIITPLGRDMLGRKIPDRLSAWIEHSSARDSMEGQAPAPGRPVGRGL